MFRFKIFFEIRTLTREFNRTFPTEKKLQPSDHQGSSELYQVGSEEKSLTITNLRPFTVYGVTVRALNQVRSLTSILTNYASIITGGPLQCAHSGCEGSDACDRVLRRVPRPRPSRA